MNKGFGCRGFLKSILITTQLCHRLRDMSENVIIIFSLIDIDYLISDTILMVLGCTIVLREQSTH